MPYPPPVLPVNRTDALGQQTNHPADHNAVNGAVNDIAAELGVNPSGGFATVEAAVVSFSSFFTPNDIEGIDRWATGIGMEIQANTSVVTTNATGDGHVTFAHAFGRNPIVLMTPGDVSGAYVFTMTNATRSLTGFDFHAVIPWTGQPAATLQVRVNWLAIAARIYP